MENDFILSVKNLNVEFDGEKIIGDLSFEVKENETFVILGPNGAGKTVLLRALLGLVPHSGEIVWRPDVKIGYVPQRLPLIKDLPLNVEEFFKFKNVSKRKISEILDSVGMKAGLFLKKRLGLLSSGQFQRLLIAWGLVNDPAVLLFDEPTAGIDIGGEETVYGLLGKAKKEKNLTVLLVTHDLSVVFGKADKVLCLNKEKVCYGSPAQALTPENLAKLFGEGVKFYEHNHV